jgi:hypothetical protein
MVAAAGFALCCRPLLGPQHLHPFALHAIVLAGPTVAALGVWAGLLWVIVTSSWRLNRGADSCV